MIIEDNGSLEPTDSEDRFDHKGHRIARHHWTDKEREKVFAEPGDRVAYATNFFSDKNVWSDYVATRQVFHWENDPWLKGREALLAEGALEPDLTPRKP